LATYLADELVRDPLTCLYQQGIQRSEIRMLLSSALTHPAATTKLPTIEVEKLPKQTKCQEDIDNGFIYHINQLKRNQRSLLRLEQSNGRKQHVVED